MTFFPCTVLAHLGSSLLTFFGFPSVKALTGTRYFFAEAIPEGDVKTLQTTDGSESHGSLEFFHSSLEFLANSAWFLQIAYLTFIFNGTRVYL